MCWFYLKMVNGSKLALHRIRIQLIKLGCEPKTYKRWQWLQNSEATDIDDFPTTNQIRAKHFEPFNKTPPLVILAIFQNRHFIGILKIFWYRGTNGILAIFWWAPYGLFGNILKQILFGHFCNVSNKRHLNIFGNIS